MRQTNDLLIDTLIQSEALNIQVQKAKDELYHLAHHDLLTNLPNRILFQDRLTQALDLANRHNHLLTVMFIDLDKFKNVNDTYGHKIGDKLLQLVALSLLDCMRSSDTVCRWSGDEFIILLPQVEAINDVFLFAQKILDKLSTPFIIDSNSISISGSIGICINESNDIEALINNADAMMYKAKRSGRNTFEFF